MNIAKADELLEKQEKRLVDLRYKISELKMRQENFAYLEEK